MTETHTFWRCALCKDYHLYGTACPTVFPSPTSGSDTILADMDKKLRQLGAEIDRLKTLLDNTPVQTEQESICTCPGKPVARERGPVTFFVCEDCGGRK